MSIETFDNETLPRNGHTLPSFNDGLRRAAPELHCLRDALQGATGLAALLRRDATIADLHESSKYDLRGALLEGVPFDFDTRSRIEAALCVCLDVAWRIGDGLTDAAATRGSAGLGEFVDDELLAEHRGRP